MLGKLGLLWRILRALWCSGVLRLTWRQALGAAGVFARCGRSFATLAELAASRAPGRCALVDEQGSLTFAELAAGATDLAHELQLRHGVGAGTQVALLGRNRRQLVVALLAASRLGADVVVLSADTLAPALRAILASERIALVLHDAEFAPLLGDVVTADRLHCIEQPAAPRTGPPLPRPRRPGQIAVLTSGSTGIPKGIRRRPTFSSLLPALAGLLEALPMVQHRPVVMAIPLGHGYGVTTLAVALALTAPLYLARRPEIGPLLARCSPDEPPLLVTIPTLLHRWLRQESEPPPGIRPAAIVTGSAPLDPGLCRRLLQRFGPVLFNMYGSTEAGLIALARPGELEQAPGTVGHPLPGTTVQLLDRAGQPVAPGDCGRLQVRGPLVVKPGPGGWYDTGDLGRRDEQGRLFIVGRADEMFVSGGENVYPAETEAVLATHPALLEVAIAVLPDEEYGARMVAWVVAAQPGTVNEEQLREWLKTRLERHKLPRRIRVVPTIPRNALGKVDRSLLLEQALHGAGTEDEPSSGRWPWPAGRSRSRPPSCCGP